MWLPPLFFSDPYSTYHNFVFRRRHKLWKTTTIVFSRVIPRSVKRTRSNIKKKSQTYLAPVLTTSTWNIKCGSLPTLQRKRGYRADRETTSSPGSLFFTLGTRLVKAGLSEPMVSFFHYQTTGIVMRAANRVQINVALQSVDMLKWGT